MLSNYRKAKRIKELETAGARQQQLVREKLDVVEARARQHAVAVEERRDAAIAEAERLRGVEAELADAKSKLVAMDQELAASRAAGVDRDRARRDVVRLTAKLEDTARSPASIFSPAVF